MRTYLLSPRAYKGLENLAMDPEVGADFQRCLRFLEMTAENGEAVIVERVTSWRSFDILGWQPLLVCAQLL